MLEGNRALTWQKGRKEKMLKPREGEMICKDLEELAHYYMFISACLTKKDNDKLKNIWNEQGGYETIDWWKFAMENVKVELDIK